MIKCMQQNITSYQQNIKIVILIAIFIITINCGQYYAVSQSIAYNPLIKCNITCQLCQSYSSSTCLMCPQYFSQQNNDCLKSDQPMVYHQYFFETNLRQNKLPLNFYINSNKVSNDNIFTFCVSNIYKFDAIGLFKYSENVSLFQSFLYQSASIALNFRLFYINSTVLKILINKIQSYTIQLPKGIDDNWLNNNTTYGAPQNDDKGIKLNIGIINEDNISDIIKYFIQIRTGMINVNSKDVQIFINVDQGYWTIMELSVVSVLCGSCVTDSIKKLAGILGIIIAVSSVIIIILLLLLNLYSKIKRANYRKVLKKQFQETQRKTVGMRRKPT